MDKPANHEQPIEFRPNAVGDTAVAVRSEPKFSMRLDSTVLTPSLSNHFPDKQPTSVFELTRIWSYVESFQWTTAQQTAGEEIYSITAFPGDNKYINTMVGYFSKMYAAYSGSLEFRFDIVGTQFHTGSISMGWIPFQTTFTEMDSRSALFKYHDLREQMQVMFNVPYVDTNVLRIVGNNQPSCQPLQSVGDLKVFVQNSLVPIGTVTPSVEVLVFVRAGDDFHYSLLQNPNFYIDTLAIPPSVHTADGQMDDGSKEVEDTTGLFSTLSSHGVAINIGEDHEMIPDILKRWVKIDTEVITDTLVRNLDYPFDPTQKTNPAAMVMNCFRYKRGGECFMLVFEPVDSAYVAKVKSRAVTILPMNTNTYVPPTTLPAPQSIGSFAVTPTTLPSVPTLTTPTQTSSPFGIVGSNLWSVDTTTSSVMQPIFYYVNPATPSNIDNSLMSQSINDITAIDGAIAGNNTESTFWNGQVNTANGIINSNFTGIKTAMDTNVGINTFNSTVQSSVNGLSTQVSNFSGVMNTNMTNTNTNNASLVAAIDDSGSGIITAVTPATISIVFQPPNCQSDTTATDSFRGVPSQIVCTDINRTAKIYVPYYSVFNYQSWRNSSTLKKEMLAKTLGRLVITTTKPVKMDLYWTAGDDMYPCKVIGKPFTTDIDPSFEVPFMREYEDDGGVDEVDGQMEQASTSTGGETVPRIDNTSNFLSKTFDRGYSSFKSVAKNIAHPFTTIYTSTTRANTMMDSAEAVMVQMRDCANHIVEYLKKQFEWITNSGQIFSSILHLLQCFVNPSLPTCLIAITGIITTLGLLSIDSTTRVIDLIASNLKRQPPTEQNTGRHNATGHCEHVECRNCERFSYCQKQCEVCSQIRPLFDSDTCATLGGLVIGAIGAALGLKSMPSGTGLCTGLFKVTSTFWMSVTHSIRFLKDFITLCVRAFKKCGRNDPAVQEALVVTDDYKGIRQFVQEAQLMMDMVNRPAIIESIPMRARFWLCVTKAYSLQAKLIERSQPETRSILQLCDKVIKLGNELAVQSTNCPVRYEPFVMALKGSTAVGKSYLLTSLLPELLADKGKMDKDGKLVGNPGLGVETYHQAVFTRTAGVEFWNGYTAQPAVLYDDFLASTDPTLACRQVVEMFNLKSSAVMNCNMASLEDKCLQANPFIVALAMNKMIVPNGITEPKAFLRRKDTMWEAYIRPMEGKKITQRTDYSYADQQVFKHLLFRKYGDVADERSLLDKEYSYAEFVLALKKEIREYHAREKVNVSLRYERMKVTLPEHARSMLDETDPFRIFYSAYMDSAQNCPVQTGFLPSETMKHQLDIFMNTRQAIAEAPNGQGKIGDMIEVVLAQVRKCKTDYPQVLKTRLVKAIFGEQQLMNENGLCQICANDEPQQIYKVCQNNSEHIVCQTCSHSWGEVNPGRALKCGLCNVPMYQLVYSPITFMSCIKAVAQNCYNRVPSRQELMMSWKFWCSISFVYICAMNILFSSAVALQLYQDDKFYATLLDQPFNGEMVTNWYGYTSYYPDGANGHMENPVIIERPKVVYFWRRNDERYPPVVTVNKLCLHHELLRSAGGDIDYEWDRGSNIEYGEWIYGTLHTQRAPDNKCDGKDCPFTNEQRKEMIINWREYREASILEGIRAVGNTPTKIMVHVPPDFLSPDFRRIRADQNAALLRHLDAAQSVSIWDRLKGVWKEYGRYIKIAGALVGTIASIMAGYSFLRSLWHDDEDVAGGQMAASGDFKTLKLPRVKSPKGIHAVNGQMGDEFDLALRKIARNTVFVEVEYVRNGSKYQWTFRGLGLFDRTAVFTAHEMRAMLHVKALFDVGQVTNFTMFVRPFQARGISTIKELTVPFVLQSDTIKFTKSDLSIVEMPTNMPQFKDIVNLIASSSQHSNNYGQLEMLVTSKASEVVEIVKTPIKGRIKEVNTNATEFYDAITSWNCYLTEFGRTGQCGSIGIVRANSPIMCFHIAGVTNLHRGYELPLIREDFIAIRKNHVPLDVFIPELHKGNGHIQLEGNIWKIGLLSKAQTPHTGDKTKIIPSKIQGKMEDIPLLTFPRILSSRDPRFIKGEDSPLKAGCLKHCNPPKELPRRFVEIAKNDYLKKILKYCKPVRMVEGPLDVSEAITGFNGMDYYDQMKLNTSAGWPLNLNAGKSKDNYIIIERNESGDPIEVQIHKELAETLAIHETLRKNGCRPWTCFEDTVKDERGKEGKSARIFSQSPTAFSIVSRQYNLDFSASFMTHRHDLEHAIGISVNSPEWRIIVETLLQKGNNIVSGDFSDYGPRIWSSLVRASGEIINAWYEHVSSDPNEKEHSLIRTIMIEEIASCYHICNNLVYQVFCGIPSGHPLTVILNSMCHSLLIRVAWVEMMSDTPFAGLKSLDNETALITYGDDHLLSVSDRVKDFFNCITLGEYLSRYDFKYTDATKVGNVKYTKIQEATFLKCGFKVHETRSGHWFAPIDEISIHECAQWVFKSADFDAATLENADQSLRLAYGHGKKYFDDWKYKLNKALKEESLTPLTLSWEECDEMFFGQEPLTYKGGYVALEFNSITEELQRIKLRATGDFKKEDVGDKVVVLPSEHRFTKRFF